MYFPKRLFPRIDKKLPFLFLISSSLLISFYYRSGGTRDFGLYAAAGEAFLTGENAYETMLWRSGSFGAATVWLFSVIWPKAILPFLYQITTYVGFWLFARFLGLPKDKTYWAFGFILFLSPVREVVNTLQITGFVLGLLAFSLTATPHSLRRYVKIICTLQASALAVALDLKPHSIIFVVLLLFIKDFKRQVIYLAGLIVALGHFAIDLINGKFLEIAWIKELTRLGNASGQNGESTSPWKLIDYLSGGAVDTGILSMFIIILILALSVRRIKKLSNTNLVQIGLVLSSLMTYMHYYDLAPLAVCVLIRYFIGQQSSLVLATILFMFLPREISSVSNLIILTGLLTLLILVKPQDGSNLSRAAKHVSKSAMIYCGLHLLNSQLNWDYRLLHAAVTSQTMFMIFLVFLGFIDKPKKVDLNVAARNPEEKN